MKADGDSYRGRPANRLANRKAMSTRAIMLFILAGLTTASAPSQRAERPRQPEAVACPRDSLTAYTGKAAGYQRTPERVQVSIHTDWDTVETVRIDLRPDEDVRVHFLFRGKPYGQRSLDEIEVSPGKLHAGMRITAWVCQNGPQPLFDWRPPAVD